APWFGAAAAMMVASIAAIGIVGSNVRAQNTGALPATVNFPSGDGRTSLIGYVFAPAQPRAARAPAVVMMHRRAGPYSANVKKSGPYNASTLSKRHKMWGQSWSALGYVAVLVDGFAPRGYPGGFGQGTYSDRPDVVNEVTVRPLDAYGALAYLRTRSDVAGDRVGLQRCAGHGGGRCPRARRAHPGRRLPRRPSLLRRLRVASALRRARLQAVHDGAGFPRHERRRDGILALRAAGRAQPHARRRHLD